MHESYKLVIVNILSFAILLIATLVYRYKYPKKKINLHILLILISILPIISIFRPGDYQSGDFNIHIYRTVAFYQSLSEGHFMPSWAGGLNATYGYALFIFNYPLPYYLMSLFHFFGASFILSMKLFLALSYFLSGIFMYLCGKKLFKKITAAFVSAIFYLFAPYHLIDLHFKVVIGEILLFAIFPLVLYCLLTLWEKRSIFWFALTALSVALLIMAHVSIALSALVLIFCYMLFEVYKQKKVQILYYTLSSFILGSIATLYIWLTPFFLSKYTIIQKMTFSLFFPPFWELLYSPYRYGLLFQGPHGEITLLIGYSQLLVILILVILLLLHKIQKKQKPYTIFWLAAFCVSIFLFTSPSQFLWENVPFLKTTGDGQRFLLLASFEASILAGYLSFYLTKKPKLLWLLIGVTIISTILNWGQRTMIPSINDSQLINQVWQENQHFYANSIWRSVKNPWFAIPPKTHLETISGKAKIKQLQRSSTTHTYIIAADTKVLINENTLYFPGWHVYDNNKPLPTHPDIKTAVIQFSLPKGLHYITVFYTDIYTYRILKIISFIGFSCILVLLGVSLIRKTQFK